jgi:hypothetical protein
MLVWIAPLARSYVINGNFRSKERFPQWLKPHCKSSTYGAAEAAPFQNNDFFKATNFSAPFQNNEFSAPSKNPLYLWRFVAG